MFDVLVVQPIFNLLVFIYALLPGHDFGLSIILFTIVVRLLMWPLVKKQLHQAKAMRAMQPDIKRVKKAAAGNKQKESAMLMELYKERNISPFGSLGTLIVQFIILIGLFVGLNALIKDPNALIDKSYGFVQSMSWIEAVAADPKKFDETLFGAIDLTKPTLPNEGGFYLPAFILVLASAAAQYFQSVQLMPRKKDGRSLRQILREAGTGKEADQSEVGDAVMRNMQYFLPVLLIVFSLKLASALSLYWFVGSLVAYIQQARILGKDEEEMEALADQPDREKNAVEGEVVEKKSSTKNSSSKTKNKKSKSSKTSKRRKK